MSEKPILFSTPMVRAILEGRKTMTRRVIKTWQANYPIQMSMLLASCPYGQVGDRLWVRETCQYPVNRDGTPVKRAIYKADISDADLNNEVCDWAWKPSIFMPRWASRITLEITNVRVERLQDITGAQVISEGVQYPVTQERHPLLRLTGKHPPCEYLPPGLLKDIKITEDMWLLAHFASLWDDLNFSRGYPWASNPWVWVIEFVSIKELGR